MVYKCYVLAKSLSEKEWSSFCKSAERSNYESSPDFIPFIKVVESAYPNFQISNHEILQQVYKGQKHNPSRLRVLRTYLKQLLEDFIINQELKKGSHHRKRILIEALKNRKCFEPAKKELENALGLLSESQLSLENLESTLSYEELQLDLFIRSNQMSLKYPWENLIQLILNLGLAKKLRVLSAAVSVKNFSESSSSWYESAIGEARKEYLTGNFQNQPYIQLFYHLLSLINRNHEENHYHFIVSIIKDSGQDFEKTELQNVFGLMINFFMQQARFSVEGSLRKAFETYQEMNRQDLIFGHGVFSERITRNIVTIGVMLGENQWTKTFLQDAYTKLPESNKDNIVNGGNALILFSQKRYSQAKIQLSKMAFMSPFYRFYHDLLMMRICYETADYEAFNQVFLNFKRHISRKVQIGAELRNVATNVATAINLLIEFRLKPSAGDIRPLREKILSLKPITHSEWLEEKILELEQAQP